MIGGNERLVASSTIVLLKVSITQSSVDDGTGIIDLIFFCNTDYEG